MPYKLSRCVALQTPDLKKAITFYEGVIGLKVKSNDGQMAELGTEPIRLFLDTGAPLGPVMEFVVPDLEKAKQELLKAGCQIIRWEGKGKPCYIRDPFGFLFNIYEEPETFK